MHKLLVVGCLLLLAGCSSRRETVLGVKPSGPTIVPVGALKEGPPVVIQGTMVEKCPVAGCWFMLRDKSGLIKVDTKGAGFVVSDVPLNSTVKVSGVLKTSGERLIAASGLSY